ncbi:MAG: alpha/beta fold hydrolase, partial [Alphaproteobacteria bacterium]
AAGLLDHLGVASAHLVGMSMGGMIAQTLAARYPQRCRSLTSIFSTTGARRVGQPALSMMWRLAQPPARSREEAVTRYLAIVRHIAASGFELAHQPPGLGRDEGAPAGFGEGAGHLHRAALDAARVQPRQHLQHRRPRRRGGWRGGGGGVAFHA